MEEKYYTLQDISEKILTPIPYLRRMIKEGKLRGKFIGKKYVVSNTDIENYLKSTEVTIWWDLA